MSVVVITPPAAPVVTLGDAKKHLRAEDFNDDDSYIESLVAAATGIIDGPAGWLGRALITQTLELRADEFCDDIALRYPPIASISSVKYDDGDGVEQTLSSGVYRLVGNPSAPRLARVYGESWPSTRWQSEAIRVRYVAGYGAASTAVPPPIRQAILLMVGELYENREAASDAPRTELPFAVNALLSPFRIFS